jgi:hypothetical protein
VNKNAGGGQEREPGYHGGGTREECKIISLVVDFDSTPPKFGLVRHLSQCPHLFPGLRPGPPQVSYPHFCYILCYTPDHCFHKLLPCFHSPPPQTFMLRPGSQHPWSGSWRPFQNHAWSLISEAQEEYLPLHGVLRECLACSKH